MLATPTTVNKKLYDQSLTDKGITVAKPTSAEQEELGEIINRLVRMQSEIGDQERVLEIAKQLQDNGAQSLLLACTDLQLLDLKPITIPIFDTMAILAKATANRISKPSG